MEEDFSCLKFVKQFNETKKSGGTQAPEPRY
jgi:hypothetical protein